MGLLLGASWHLISLSSFINGSKLFRYAHMRGLILQLMVSFKGFHSPLSDDAHLWYSMELWSKLWCLLRFPWVFHYHFVWYAVAYDDKVLLVVDCILLFLDFYLLGYCSICFTFCEDRLLFYLGKYIQSRSYMTLYDRVTSSQMKFLFSEGVRHYLDLFLF